MFLICFLRVSDIPLTNSLFLKTTMKKLLFIFFIIFACSEGITQKKETTRIKNVNPIFPLGIRFPVNPKTGKPIVCNSWDENQVFSDPEYSSIGDLTCFIYFADSTMKNILDKIVSKLGKNSNSSKKLLLSCQKRC